MIGRVHTHTHTHTHTLTHTRNIISLALPVPSTRNFTNTYRHIIQTCDASDSNQEAQVGDVQDAVQRSQRQHQLKKVCVETIRIVATDNKSALISPNKSKNLTEKIEFSKYCKTNRLNIEI